jgi:hypothetical protein
VYYRFSFDKGLGFGIEDAVKVFEIIVRLSTFSCGNDFIVRVGAGCGDDFLGIADSDNFAPAAVNAVVL